MLRRWLMSNQPTPHDYKTYRVSMQVMIGKTFKVKARYADHLLNYEDFKLNLPIETRNKIEDELQIAINQKDEKITAYGFSITHVQELDEEVTDE